MSIRSVSSEQYREAWQSHINEFTCVLLESGIPVKDWDSITFPMQDALDKAVERLGKQDTWKVLP